MSTIIATKTLLPHTFSITLRAAWAANYDVTYVNDTFTEITLDLGRRWGSPEIELNWFICQRLPPPLNFHNLYTYFGERKIRS